MDLVVLSDFDGTVTTFDTAEWVLTRFSQGDWKQFERQFERGELTLEECLVKEFSLVRASKRQILRELKSEVMFRPNFKKLAEHCKKNHVPLTIVSAGLDFVIRYFLKLNDCLELVDICAPKTTLNSNRITLTFPEQADASTDNFKQDTVRYYKSQNLKVVYVGDGQADCAAAKDSDYPFAILGSRLAALCKNHGIACKEITDFQKVIDAIEEIESNITPKNRRDQERRNQL